MKSTLLFALAFSILHSVWANSSQECLALWPSGPGTATVPQDPNAELLEIMSEIDQTRIQAIVEKLVSFGTRHTLSNQTDPFRGIGAARDWIAMQMNEIAAPSEGRMTVTVQSYVQQPAVRITNATVISNIVATLTGSSDPNRVYVISGHYDSRVTDVMDFTSDSPGADDDASGVAIAMELARIMATRQPAATIIFAAVAGEEQDLYGSAFMAQQLADAGADVQGMFTNDIVGSPKADDGTVDPFSIRLFAQGVPVAASAELQATLESIGGENDSPARELGRFVTDVASNSATQMNVRVIYRADRFLRGGDHLSFLNQGFPAARFTEPHENFDHQHQDVVVINGTQFGDLIEFCDFDFITRVAKVNAAVMWSLAQAPGTPKNATIDVSVLSNVSNLSWAVAADENLAGFEVVWRETFMPFWTDVVPVGMVSSTTINLSKDNVVFGIRAVGANGLRSPAALPIPN